RPRHPRLLQTALHADDRPGRLQHHRAEHGVRDGRIDARRLVARGGLRVRQHLPRGAADSDATGPDAALVAAEDRLRVPLRGDRHGDRRHRAMGRRLRPPSGAGDLGLARCPLTARRDSPLTALTRPTQAARLRSWRRSRMHSVIEDVVEEHVTYHPTTQDGSDTRDLLWTSGWDSTFRLLSALLLEDATVRPHYVVDPRRRSTGAEMKAMDRIRSAIEKQYPDVASRVAPTRFAKRDELPVIDKTARRFSQLAATGDLGGQYEWLARYAAAAGLVDLELAIHHD